MIATEHLLFIEPGRIGETSPLIDGATRRMAAAFRQAKPIEPYYFGFHTCKCRARSAAHNFLLPNDRLINSLCVHYLAYHRDEVPLDQLGEVESLEFGEVEPSEPELRGATWGADRARPAVPIAPGRRNWLSSVLDRIMSSK